MVIRRSIVAAACAVVLLAACGSSDARPRAHAQSSTTMDPNMKGMDHGTHGEDASDAGLSMLRNGHHSEMSNVKLNATDQAALDAQLAITREVALKYPTVAAAKAAGYTRAGPFAPGLGAHYIAPVSSAALNPDGVEDPEDLQNPLSILYDGTDPDSKVVGFMYYSLKKDAEGFVGPNDFWHFHTNVCQKPAADGGTDSPLGADGDTTKAQCEAAGGYIMNETQYMTHVWTVPGYEVSAKDGGVFAEANPKVKCPDGTYFMMTEKDFAAHPMSVCRSEL